jgi:hypothetical protein
MSVVFLSCTFHGKDVNITVWGFSKEHSMEKKVKNIVWPPIHVYLLMHRMHCGLQQNMRDTSMIHFWAGMWGMPLKPSHTGAI